MEREDCCAAMAAYLETLMSAALHHYETHSHSVEVLHALTDSVRSGSRGAFEALCLQLRPVLIRLAGQWRVENPRELTTALFLAVQAGKKDLTWIERDITTRLRNKRRGEKRETQNRGHLALVRSQGPGSMRDRRTGESVPLVEMPEIQDDMIKKIMEQLTPIEQQLWILRGDKTPYAEIAAELGITEGAARKRWFDLERKLRGLLRDFGHSQ